MYICNINIGAIGRLLFINICTACTSLLLLFMTSPIFLSYAKKYNLIVSHMFNDIKTHAPCALLPYYMFDWPEYRATVLACRFSNDEWLVAAIFPFDALLYETLLEMFRNSFRPHMRAIPLDDVGCFTDTTNMQRKTYALIHTETVKYLSHMPRRTLDYIVCMMREQLNALHTLQTRQKNK